MHGAVVGIVVDHDAARAPAAKSAALTAAAGSFSDCCLVLPSIVALAVQDVGRLQAAILGHGAELGEQQAGADMLVLVEQLGIVLDGVGDLADVAQDAALHAP